MLERIMDLAAVELGIDPVELRRRNFLHARRVPVHHAARAPPTTAATTTCRCARRCGIAGYDELRAEQARGARAATAVQLGIGVAVYVEITAGGGGRVRRRSRSHDDGTRHDLASARPATARATRRRSP